MSKEKAFNVFARCSGLHLAQDGIYYSAASEAVSYPEEGNEACFEVEDRSFWFRHRNDCIRELVRKFASSWILWVEDQFPFL